MSNKTLPGINIHQENANETVNLSLPKEKDRHLLARMRSGDPHTLFSILFEYKMTWALRKSV